MCRAVRIFLRRSRVSRSDRIVKYVLHVSLERLLIRNSNVRKTSLPNFAIESEFLLGTVRKSALDQLHSAFDRRAGRNFQQRVKMIPHDDELMHYELSRRRVLPQNIDQQFGHVLRLEHILAFGSLRRNEIDSSIGRTADVRGMARWLRHARGLSLRGEDFGRYVLLKLLQATAEAVA